MKNKGRRSKRNGTKTTEKIRYDKPPASLSALRFGGAANKVSVVPERRGQLLTAHKKQHSWTLSSFRVQTSFTHFFIPQTQTSQGGVAVWCVQAQADLGALDATSIDPFANVLLLISSYTHPNLLLSPARTPKKHTHTELDNEDLAGIRHRSPHCPDLSK